VHDNDIQSNAERYLAETGYKGISHGITWEEARLAITYWSRIIIENTPQRVYWWENHAALDEPPEVWNAPVDTVYPRYPRSDPAPPGQMKPSAWQVRPWRDVAEDAVRSGDPAHLSVVDDDGFPVPMRAHSYQLLDDGFRLVMPKGLPWTPAGKASLTFAGFRTFVGEALPQNGTALMRVERALPQPPPPTRLALVRQSRIASDSPITGITEEHGNRMT
jgi:hypothetical protein